MKVLLLGDIASAHLQKWAISLAKNRMEIGIFSFNHSNENWWESHQGITVLNQAVKKKTTSTFFSKFSYLFLTGRLKKAIKSFKPDILHAHYASSYGLIGRLSGFHPFVISVWGTDVIKFPLQNFITKFILTKNFEQADLICATSFALKKHCSNYTSKTCEVIPFGIDLKQFYYFQKPIKNEIIIGCVKSLEPVYRIDLLIDAFALLKLEHQGISLKLLIVGGGSLEHELKLKVKGLGIHQSVEFTGKVSHVDVPEYYQKMDIFCNLSSYESFGVSIIEAMACGIPVIASPTEGAKEIITNKELGIILNTWDKSEIKTAMVHLIDNHDMRTQISSRALHYAACNYNWENNVLIMIEKYKLLMK